MSLCAFNHLSVYASSEYSLNYVSRFKTKAFDV